MYLSPGLKRTRKRVEKKGRAEEGKKEGGRFRHSMPNSKVEVVNDRHKLKPVP